MTRKREPLRLLVAALLSLLALTGAAAAQEASGEEEPKWFTVEAVIFERTDPEGLKTEQWVAHPGEPELGGTVELSDTAGRLLDAELSGDIVGLAHAFRSLAGGERQLQGVVGRLERSQAYRPLMHVAWRQPGFSLEQSKAVHVHMGPRLLHPRPEGGEPSAPPFPMPSAFAEEAAPADAATMPSGNAPETVAGSAPLSTALEGTLRLHLARYLHLQADLLYYRPPPADPLPADDSPATARNESPAGEPAAAEVWHPTLFRLQESRRMRSGELHYLDHPLFGVLALVTPFEVPKPAETPEGEE
ncbi:MAG: hypothetical protein GWN84_09115 [Gammaproteobacteria bacterium]|nr:hypothetical protein [Gammaproteobacteria bacterium]NIR83033.1 hypothetical protein [Gammaproteobacteria bacterium]NIR90695.1 hypothetical protein [Gammaproteobacteria bacterium]NIU04186.1 hypothetical protein [Gammaproteobacteria bacterium]NIV51478.1 hypothetical protein [Gammaproteobacteria bacterium]